MPDFTEIEKEHESVSSDKNTLEHGIETSPLANWQAIGIGTLVGIVTTILVFVFTFKTALFDNQGRIAFAGLEIILSMAGAMICKSKRKTLRAVWTGAIIGSLSPGLLAIVWILVVSFFFRQ